MNVPDAIGGYFGLELSPQGPVPYPQAHTFQSARAAFLALLRHSRPARVWMPWMICDSMMEPLRATGVPVTRYAIDETFDIDRDVSPSLGDWLLYVNYFGLQDDRLIEILRRFRDLHVVIDNAQAFYSRPTGAAATLYSPRKFFGVPDGGLLVTSFPVVRPTEVDDGSVARSAHLLMRLATGAEAGYRSFVAAEESLVGQEPRQMSPLTSALLTSVNYVAARERRRRNFEYLHRALKGLNGLRIALNDSAVPLCYPFRTANAELRSALIRARIYVPTYWPEVARGAIGAPSVERALGNEILPLPCDQRYGDSDMDTILCVVSHAKGRL